MRDELNLTVKEITRRLHHEETVTLSTPVLALGAQTIQGRPKTAIATLTLRFAEGALGYVLKPVTKERLSAMIERAMTHAGRR